MQCGECVCPPLPCVPCTEPIYNFTDPNAQVLYNTAPFLGIIGTIYAIVTVVSLIMDGELKCWCPDF